MPKKMSMQQRLMEFGLSAGASEVENAIETLKACLNARSPKPVKKAKRTRTLTEAKAAGAAGDQSSSAS